MILNDMELARLVYQNNEPLVYPVSSNGIQPASVDIRLGDEFIKPSETILYKSSDNYNSFDIQIEYDKFSGSYLLGSHEFILASTVEIVRIPHDLTAFIQGRSSIGRMGLFINNAGWVDPGFEGKLALQLYNASEVPILLKPFTRIAQLVFCKMDAPCAYPYKGKYQGVKSDIGSKINLDKENLK